jgi:hypothetical protein
MFYEDSMQIKPEAYLQSGPRFKIELEFRNVDFYRGRKTLEARERINNILNSHMTPSPILPTIINAHG